MPRALEAAVDHGALRQRAAGVRAVEPFPQEKLDALNKVFGGK